MDGHPGNYLDRILLIKGTRTEAQVAATMSAEGALSEATVGYNIGLWHLLNGRKDKAREYFTRVVATGYSTGVGLPGGRGRIEAARGGTGEVGPTSTGSTPLPHTYGNGVKD